MTFIKDKVDSEGLTFDDVLLLPSYSKVLPRDVNISSKFTKNIKLNSPIISAAMDTVTEDQLAIAIAREGGIGVIHKNMSIKEQARQVRIVKRSENAMISDPVTIDPESTVADVILLIEEHKVGGIPVIDSTRKLVGIVTNRDLRFQTNPKRKISEVMTKDNLITTSISTNLEKAAETLQEHRIEKLPIVDNDFKLVGLLTYKDISSTKARPNACKDSQGRLRVAAGVGIAPDTLKRISGLNKEK